MRDQAFAANSPPLQGTYLVLWQWTRLAHAMSSELLFKVVIEMEGIPPQAWSLATANEILGSSCWIECLDLATANRTYLSKFKLSTWTDDPDSIPTSHDLRVAEPEAQAVYDNHHQAIIFGNVQSFMWKKVVLNYKVIIHLRSVVDHQPQPPSSPSGASSPSSDGDSGPDGNPDHSYGADGGSFNPRFHGFLWRRGIIDGKDLQPDRPIQQGPMVAKHDKTKKAGDRTLSKRKLIHRCRSSNPTSLVGTSPPFRKRELPRMSQKTLLLVRQLERKRMQHHTVVCAHMANALTERRMPGKTYRTKHLSANGWITKEAFSRMTAIELVGSGTCTKPLWQHKECVDPEDQVPKQDPWPALTGQDLMILEVTTIASD